MISGEPDLFPVFLEINHVSVLPQTLSPLLLWQTFQLQAGEESGTLGRGGQGTCLGSGGFQGTSQEGMGLDGGIVK